MRYAKASAGFLSSERLFFTTRLTKRMIALAKKDSIAYWQKELPMAREAELEMMYTHLSNGLMHVVVEDYERYSK